MLLSENCHITTKRIEALDMDLKDAFGHDYHTRHPNLLAAAAISVALERVGDILKDLPDAVLENPQ